MVLSALPAVADRPRPVVAPSVPVVGAGRLAAYRVLRLHLPEVAATARPGQFLALGVGGAESARLLRRAVAVAGSDPDAGVVEVVVAAAGPGSAWLADLDDRPGRGATVDVVGPLGTWVDDAPPGEGRPSSVVLVGGGYGTAPLVWAAAALQASGWSPVLLAGAAGAGRLGVDLADPRLAGCPVLVTTDDGSAGRRGRVTDVLAPLLAGEQVDGVAGPVGRVVACGPTPMLRAVADLGAAADVRCEVSVEETMACGIGVCMTCVLPVRHDDGVVRMTRACVDGPVLDASRVLLDAVGTVPPGTEGAPT